MNHAFQRHTDPILGEEVWLTTSSSGLPVRVLPRPHMKDAAAVISFAYGSTDLDFEGEDGLVRTPAGTAHYLEHKLFEDEELQVFQRFAQRGARVNAQTGFTRTSYFFQASSHFEANLADLLRLVSKPHITAANVDKERGIIAQEVQMYEDSPGYCTMFDLLGCLYPEHPVRHTVGGTTDSIGEITPELLLASWRAFYRTGNAALAVAGDVDPGAVLDLVEQAGLPVGSAPRRVHAADFGPVGTVRRKRRMQVARPKVLVGIKDRREASGWREQTARRVATSVVLDRLFAASSELREALQLRAAIDDSLSAGYYGEVGFAFASVGCEHEDPERAEQAFREMLLGPVEFGDEHLERLRRRHLGGFVRSCENARALAFGHAAEALEGAPPFHAVQAMQQVQLAEVQQRKIELLDEGNLDAAVTVADGS
jgi:predicted Zn-dependent peptidase